MKDIQSVIDAVSPLSSAAMEAARKRQAKLAKPPGSLGRLEELSIQLAGITGNAHNQVKVRHLLIFAADNGVVAEGIASTPPSVTAQQSVNLTLGKTGAAVLAAHFGCKLTVYDVGVNADLSGTAVINRKLAFGTGNIARGPAMPREMVLKALQIGAEAALEAIAGGAEVLGIGEMGIGNTTTSAAVTAALTGLPAEKAVGRGAGLTDEAFRKKQQVVRMALQINAPDPADPVDVLAKVGGLDLAAMAGAFLGAAAGRRPAVIDGFISAAAALCAVRLCPAAKGYLVPSHASVEIGSKALMEALGLSPLFDLQMRLGEGSGCPLAFEVLDAACAVLDGMATFDEAGIDDHYLEPIRRIDAFAAGGDDNG